MKTILKRAAALMIAGIVTCATFMGNGMNVKAADGHGYAYDWNRATDTYTTTAAMNGDYVYQNANRIGHTTYNMLVALNAHPLVGLAPWQDGDCWHINCISPAETAYLSNIAATYGAPAAELYLKCAQVGCFTDYYDYVGNTKWTFSDLKVRGNMPSASSIQNEENFIQGAVGPWGTLAQAEAVVAASGMTKNNYLAAVNWTHTIKKQNTPHASTVGTSGTAATVKGAATTTTGFDAVFYAQMYPDVVKAVGSSQKALYNHYVKYGKAEGRYQNLAEYQAAQQKK